MIDDKTPHNKNVLPFKRAVDGTREEYAGVVRQVVDAQVDDLLVTIDLGGIGAMQGDYKLAKSLLAQTRFRHVLPLDVAIAFKISAEPEGATVTSDTGEQVSAGFGYQRITSLRLLPQT